MYRRLSTGHRFTYSPSPLCDLTFPNTTWRPSSHAAFAVVTKNWQPFVFGPLFAMDKSPGPGNAQRSRRNQIMNNTSKRRTQEERQG